MKANKETALAKIRGGIWLFIRGVTPNAEYVKHGFSLFWRGCMDLLGIHDYPDIR